MSRASNRFSIHIIPEAPKKTRETTTDLEGWTWDCGIDWGRVGLGLEGLRDGDGELFARTKANNDNFRGACSAVLDSLHAFSPKDELASAPGKVEAWEL